jgi:hypothetical protein
MAKKTGKIAYNVHERGRKHHGQDRHFNLRALASLVNSPAVQERVKNRDLLGYYGHTIRAKFGMNPPEWVVVDGKQINIEPAIVTTYLAADENGNIEHDSEFLDTAPGQTAQRLYNSRTGGFSSAIRADPGRAGVVPTLFAGFDYVFEPNFTTNRGYLFDSVGGVESDVLLDSVIAEQQHCRAMNAIFDSLQCDHELAMQTIARLQEENEEMLSMLSKAGTAGAGVVLLDSTAGARPMTVSKAATGAFLKRAAAFKAGDLTPFEAEKEDKPAGSEDDALALTRARYGL